MQLAVVPRLAARGHPVGRLMDLAQHHAAMVAHLVWLFRHPYAGPDYARQATEVYLQRNSCPFPKIGHDVKRALAELPKEDETWK